MKNPYPDFDFASTKDDLLVAVDLSNEFTTGCLGTEHAAEMIPWCAWFARNFQGDKVATLDTHGPAYLDTQEGRRLPIMHGQKGTPGWQMAQPVADALGSGTPVFEKDTFGSIELYQYIQIQAAQSKQYKHIYFMGADTGICVISCAILAKTADPEAEIKILSGLCSCVNKHTHDTALEAMKLLQMDIIEPCGS